MNLITEERFEFVNDMAVIRDDFFFLLNLPGKKKGLKILKEKHLNHLMILENSFLA